MNNQEKKFKELYFNNFKELCLISNKVVNNMEDAQDVVQQVFISYYENEESINITTSTIGYLKRSVYNKSIDQIRKKKSKQKYENWSIYNNKSEILRFEDALEFAELEKLIFDTINGLPDRCKEVFILSRMEGKSNKEIADELNISIRTVETQISKALKTLRKTVYSISGILLVFW